LSKIVFDAEVMNITHMLVGGYDTATYREIGEIKISEPLRTSEIRSLMRFWTRAIIGAAAIDLGYDAKELATQIPKVFLGSTSLPWGGSIQSIYQVQVLIEKLERCVKAKELARRIEVVKPKEKVPRPQDVHPPRIQLLKLAKPVYMYAPGGLRARIRIVEKDFASLKSILRDVDPEDVISHARKTAIGGLLIGLTLSGVGAVTRRGFGSLKFVNAPSIEDSELRRYAEALTEGKWNKARNALRGLIKTTEEGARKLLKTLKEERRLKGCYIELESGSHFIPPIQTTHKDWCTIYMVELRNDNVVEWYKKHKQPRPGTPGLVKAPDSVDMYDKLICVGETYSRTCPLQCFAEHIKLNSIVGRLIDVQIHDPDKPKLKRPRAWILGLPRWQRNTGYKILDKKCKRRASPLLYSFITNDILVFSIFVSRDWPRKLLWRGARRRSTPVNVENAIKTCELKNLAKSLESYAKDFFKEIGIEEKKILLVYP
jgi:CRISPR type III-B/RAMP module RAMP protein Cmr1